MRMFLIFLNLTQGILFWVGPNSLSQQQIHFEDAASQIEECCISIPVSWTNIYRYRLIFNYIASTNASLEPGAHIGWPRAEILYPDSICL